MSKKKITKEELDKLDARARLVIKTWEIYRLELREFTTDFVAGTTPPGKSPPNPPGIPK